MRVFNIVILLVVCGCVPPAKKGIPIGMRHWHGQPAIPSSNGNSQNLSETEKDKLFRDFERWRAAKGQFGPGASPLADASQPHDTR
jgi:hypothetical protein